MGALSDEFGDPPAVSIEQVLPLYRGWLRKVASGLLSPGHEALDDLIQEGACAIWRACRTYDPAVAPLDYWLKRSASQRMLRVVARRDWTGHAKRNPGGRPDRPETSLDGLGPEMGIALEVEDVSSAQVLDKALWAYHAGEIARAVDTLTDRERRYVRARFWGGLTGPETDALLHTTSANIWRTARPKLHAQLGHLVPDGVRDRF